LGQALLVVAVGNFVIYEIISLATEVVQKGIYLGQQTYERKTLLFMELSDISSPSVCILKKK
jgi:hypothetical protein